MFTQWFRRGYWLQRSERILLLLMAILLVGGFALAAVLPPDPRGYGTHQQLGLPPCSIRQIFGIPCPNCGMTTCFSYFVRGEFAEAFRSNFAGVYLAVLSLLMIPWALGSAGCGRTLGVQRPLLLLILISICFILLGLAQWWMALNFE